MRELMKTLKAVADKNRMRILKMLGQKIMCVCEMSAVLGITQPSVSKHLSILKNAGLISDERNGQWMDYFLCEDKINKYAPVILSNIKGWLNNDPGIKQDLRKIKTLKRGKLCRQ